MPVVEVCGLGLGWMQYHRGKKRILGGDGQVLKKNLANRRPVDASRVTAAGAADLLPKWKLEAGGDSGCDDRGPGSLRRCGSGNMKAFKRPNGFGVTQPRDVTLDGKEKW